jgi:hypothetical protein
VTESNTARRAAGLTPEDLPVTNKKDASRSRETRLFHSMAKVQ